MMQSDPVTAQLMQQHPEMEYVLSNPSVMRSMLSPDMMQMASGMMQRMRSLPTATTMSGTPGSFPMPGSPGSDKPGAAAAPSTSPSTPSPSTGTQPPAAPNPWGMYGGGQPMMPPMFGGMFANNPFAQMMMGMRPPATVPPTAAPAASTPLSTASVSPSTTAVDYKVKYAAELAQMKDMGFPNEEENIKALKEANGDVFEAIEKVSKSTEK